MLIYTPKITSRIQYSFQLIFGTVWNSKYEITDDIDYFLSYSDIKLNYSNKRLANECFLKSYGLLSEKGISDQEIIFEKWNELPTFFHVKDLSLIHI